MSRDLSLYPFPRPLAAFALAMVFCLLSGQLEPGLAQQAPEAEEVTPSLGADEGKPAKRRFQGIFRVSHHESVVVDEPAEAVVRNDRIMILREGRVRLPMGN